MAAHSEIQQKKRGRSPGRPSEKLDADTMILDAAERLFAEHGYEGATMRQVAEASGVNQALVSYYFGSKENLFETVYRRRGTVISAARHLNLDAIEASNEEPTVKDLIRAFLLPQWELKNSGPGGAAFIRIQAALHTTTSQQAFRLRREIYDPSARRYIAALQRALPHVPADDVALRMVFLVGSYLFMLSDVSRYSDYARDASLYGNTDAMLEKLTDFMALGFQGPAWGWEARIPRL